MTTSIYRHVEMFCYSGTGNALRASQWIAERAARAGVSASITRIERGTPTRIAHRGDQLVGFLYSTHGFCAPWTVLKRLCALPRHKDGRLDVFLVNTRGGIKVGPVLMPGISGLALLLPALLLVLKGYRIVGMRPLDMPSSWFQLHPGLCDETVHAIVERRSSQLLAFIDRLLTGQRSFHGFWTLPLDLLLAPVTPFYLAFGRIGLAKLQIASRACDGCGLCADLCPMDAIRMHHGRPYWTTSCESCMRCYSACPRRAVQCSHGFLGALIVAFLLLPPLLHRAVGAALPDASAALRTAVYYALWYPMALGSVVWGYALLHALMRLRPIREVLTYASFNRYWRTYLAPGIRLVDFRRRARKTSPDIATGANTERGT